MAKVFVSGRLRLRDEGPLRGGSKIMYITAGLKPNLSRKAKTTTCYQIRVVHLAVKYPLPCASVAAVDAPSVPRKE